MTQHTQPVGGGQHQHHQQQTSTPQQQQQQQQTTTTPNTNNHNNTSNNNLTSTPTNTNLSTNNNQTQNVAVQQQQQHHQNNNNNSNNNYQSQQQQQQNATSGQMFNPQIPSGNAYAQPHLMPAAAHHHPQQHHHHQSGAMYPTMIPAAIPSSVYVHNVTANVNLHGWTHTVPHGAWVPPGGAPHYMHGDLPPEQGAPVMQSMGGMPVNLQTPNALAGPVMNPNPNAISGGTRGSRRGRGRGGTSGSRRGDYNMHRHPQPEGSPAPQQAGQNNPQDMQQQQQGQQTADGQQMILPPSYVPHSQYAGAQYPYVYPVFAPPPHILHPGVQNSAMQRAAASGQPLYFSTMPLYNGHQMYNNVYYLPPVMNQSEYQYGEEVGVAGPLGDERQSAGEGGAMMWHQQPIYTDEYGMSPADMHAVSSDDMNHNASSMGSANETPNLLSPNYTPMYEQMTQQMGVMHIYEDPQMGQIQVMHPQIGGVPQLEEELSECGSQPSTAPIQMVPTTAAAPPPPMTIEHFIPLTDSAVMPIDDTLTPNVTTPQHQQQQPHQQQQQQSITEDNAIVDNNVQTYENVSNIQAGESVTSLNEEIIVQQPAADDNITIDYQQLPQQQQIQTETDVCEKAEEETTNFNKIMKMLTTYEELPEKTVEVTVANVTLESVVATNVAVNQQQQIPQQTVYPQQQQTVQEKQHKQQYVAKQNVPQQHQQLQTQPMTAQQPPPQQQTHYQASTQQQQHHHHSQQQHHHQQQQTYENRKSSQMYNQPHQSRSRKYDYHHGSTSSNSDASSSQHHHHHHHNQQQQTQQTTKTMSWTNSSQHKKSTNSVAVTATPTSSHSSGSYNKQSNATSNTSSSHTHATRTYTNQQHHNYQQQQQQQQNYHYQQQQQQQPQTRNYGAMKMPSSPISSAPSTMERKTSQSSEAGKGNAPHTTSTASTTAAPHQFQQQQSQQTSTNDAAVQSPQQTTTPATAATVTAGSAANTTTNISNKQQQQSQHYPPGFATKKHSFSNQGHSVNPNTTAAAVTSSSSNTVETSSTPAINLAPPVSATTPAAPSTPSWASLFASSANTSSSASTNTAASSTNLNTTSGSSSSNTSFTKKPIAKVAPYEGIAPVTPPPPVVTPGTLSYSAASAQNLPTPAASTATTAKKLEQQQSQRNSLANLDEFSLKFAQFLTNYKSDWATVSLRPRGLTNRSNYCYINSILQALLGCSPLYNLIRSIPKQVANLCEVKTPTVNAMMTFMSNFSNLPSGLRLRNAKGGKGNKDDLGGDLQCDPAFEPTEIYKLWNDSREEHVEGRQEDAEEFLSYILNKLNDEMLEVIKLIAKPNNEQNGQNEPAEEDGDVWQMICNNRNKGSVTRQTDFGCTPLSDIFRGELRSRLQREGEHSTDVIQPFFTLQLNIEKAASVKEALEILVGRDQLEGVTGSKSKQEVVAWQQMNLEKLPPILILHLKWFDYRSDGCTKILKKVEFPVELKIDSKILASKKYSQKQRAYRLFAVVYHDGKEATKGHYITDVYHTGYGSWLRYDDSSVKPVSENHVLLPRTPRVPYLLCYRRCDTIPQQSNNTQNNSSTGNNNSSGNTQSSSGK